MLHCQEQIKRNNLIDQSFQPAPLNHEIMLSQMKNTRVSSSVRSGKV